jgi:hypothetical protein
MASKMRIAPLFFAKFHVARTAKLPEGTGSDDEILVDLAMKVTEADGHYEDGMDCEGCLKSMQEIDTKKRRELN